MRAALSLLVVGVIAAAAVLFGVGTSSAKRPPKVERNSQTGWAACNTNAHNSKPSTFVPLSDAAAAALVTAQPETRPDNDRPYTIAGRRYPGANEYVPTSVQIQQFRSAHTSSGQPALQFNPYFRYVDGRDGMHDPTTDDLIQWSAHKWGIPEDWLRAEYVVESYWSQFQMGDEHPVPRSWHDLYPLQARVQNSPEVYRSLGITQVQWTPNGAIGPGSNPLRWESTAFNLDYQAAMVRFYYDNPNGARTSWGDATYAPCQPWKSIGGWYRPYPWGNADQAGYVKKVRAALADRTWESGSFQSWSAPVPSAVKLCQ
jgi:hypothetical protein